jgi:hypothetical protein
VIRAVSLLLLTSLLPLTAFARQAPEPCPARRYLVTAGASRIADGTDAPVIMALAENSVAVAGGCSPTRQRLRTKRNGTRIKLRWTGCGDRSDVRLKATLDESCATMTGKVRARRLGSTLFAAVPSTCGDGVIDAGAGEQCEGDDTACTGGRPCAACRCIGDGGGGGGGGGGSNCVTEELPIEGFTHVPIGTDVAYQSNPPSSGNHYPVWADYESYTTTVARGYWMHNLEHGAVVLLHRPDAGSDVIDALRAAYEAIPLDPKCTHRRTVLTPDPLMPQPFAVVAWGFRMLCDAVDQAAILDFVAQHRDHGRESICSQGGYNP